LRLWWLVADATGKSRKFLTPLRREADIELCNAEGFLRSAQIQTFADESKQNHTARCAGLPTLNIFDRWWSKITIQKK
jgi:hypothetical protein